MWADFYKDRTGEWPTSLSGSIADAPGETWKNVDAALSQGVRGFPRGSSLARLLEQKRSVRNTICTVVSEMSVRLDALELGLFFDLFKQLTQLAVGNTASLDEPTGFTERQERIGKRESFDSLVSI
jgi:hypothetical protein